MKYIFLPVLLVFSGHFLIGQDVNIDGTDAEWTMGELMVQSGTKLAYAYRQDTEKLYVLIRANDPGTIRKVLVRGLRLWVNPDGKKKRLYGLGYPIGAMAEPDQMAKLEEKPSILAQPTAGPDKMMADLVLRQKGKVLIKGLYGMGEEPILTRLSELDTKIEVGMSLTDQDELIIEMAFPFDALPEMKKVKPEWQIGIVTTAGTGEKAQMSVSGAPMPTGVGGPGSLGQQSQLGMPGAGGGRRPATLSSSRKGFSEPIRIWTKLSVKR
ncbi:MAG: hypothetical protein AAF206_04965 [Bacteroidota bacterium]